MRVPVCDRMQQSPSAHIMSRQTEVRLGKKEKEKDYSLRVETKDHGSITSKCTRLLYPSNCPGRLWGPQSPPPPFNGYRGSGRGVVTPHLHLAPRLRMSGPLTPFPHMPSWRVQGQMYTNHVAMYAADRLTI